MSFLGAAAYGGRGAGWDGPEVRSNPLTLNPPATAATTLKVTNPRQCGSAPQQVHWPLPRGTAAVYYRSHGAHFAKAVRYCTAIIPLPIATDKGSIVRQQFPSPPAQGSEELCELHEQLGLSCETIGIVQPTIFKHCYGVHQKFQC